MNFIIVLARKCSLCVIVGAYSGLQKEEGRI